MKAMKLDVHQGYTETDLAFGYIAIGDGGYFVTWHPTLAATLDSLEPDTQDPPPDLTAREEAHMRQIVRDAFRSDAIRRRTR